MSSLDLTSGFAYGYKNWIWIIILILIIIFFYRNQAAFSYGSPTPFGGTGLISPYWISSLSNSNILFTILIIALILVIGKWCC